MALLTRLSWRFVAGMATLLATAGTACGDSFTSGGTSSDGGQAGNSPTGTTGTGTGQGGSAGSGATAGSGGTATGAGGGVSDAGPSSDSGADAGPCVTCSEWAIECIDGASGSVCDGTNLCPTSTTLYESLRSCVCSACVAACPGANCPASLPSDDCRGCLNEVASSLCITQATACMGDAPTD